MVKAYCVFVGRREGLYETWTECKGKVSGFKGAIHCAFDSMEEANNAYQNYCSERELCKKSPSAYKCYKCGVQLNLGIAIAKPHTGRHFFSCGTCENFMWVNDLIVCPCDGGLCLMKYVDVEGVACRCYYCPFEQSCGYSSFPDDVSDVDDANVDDACSGSSSGTAYSLTCALSLTLGEDNQKAKGRRVGPREGVKVMDLTHHFSVMKLKDT